MGRPAVDLTGRRFGKLQVVERDGSTSDGKASWLCRCDCGTEFVVRSMAFRQRRNGDCGCSLRTATTRRCATCRTTKRHEEFGADQRRPDGLKSRCRQCEADVRRARWRNERERLQASNRRWYSKHRDDERARSKKRSAERFMAKRHEINEKCRQRYAKDPARRRAIVAACIERNPEAAWQWQRRASQKRMARRYGAVTEPVDFERIKKRDRMICHICRKRVKLNELQFDHVIPLAKGGEHTERNLAVSHALCNQKKNAAIITLF